MQDSQSGGFGVANLMNSNFWIEFPTKTNSLGTCDKVGLVGGEIEDEGGYLVSGADASHLLARDEVLHRDIGVGMGLNGNEAHILWLNSESIMTTLRDSRLWISNYPPLGTTINPHPVHIIIWTTYLKHEFSSFVQNLLFQINWKFEASQWRKNSVKITRNFLFKIAHCVKY